MSFLPRTTLLLLVTVVLAGCNKKEKSQTSEAVAPVPPAERIAVIDLNVVAKEIGARDKIDARVKRKEDELTKEFNGLKAELDLEVLNLTNSNDDLNDQQQTQIEQITVKNKATLTLRAQAAQSILLTHHNQLKQQLLNQIRPVAYQVAQEKGMQIVLTVGQVYAAGPNVDITQDVIKRVKQLNEAEATAGASGQPAQERVAKLPGGGDFMPR